MRGAMRAYLRGQRGQRLGNVCEVLDAGGNHDLPGSDLLAGGQAELELAASPGNVGDQHLLQVRDKLGLEPAAIRDEGVPRYGQAVTGIRAAGRGAEGRQRMRAGVMSRGRGQS